eukprot:comp12489_c1_seq1/m.7441 comp12489_c1_seq1/g.7441  ORF comp12489_c1_seq1/g.7441 comp12489_c1_seq1/m.7441 type:complete len:212 (-) comp12489_c1_seq1:27-662(-)
MPQGGILSALKPNSRNQLQPNEFPPKTRYSITFNTNDTVLEYSPRDAPVVCGRERRLRKINSDEDLNFKNLQHRGSGGADRLIAGIQFDRPSDPRQQYVWLRSLFYDEKRHRLSGFATVRNIAYEKLVSVRYTMDGWMTYNEVAADYAAYFPEINPGVDNFAFAIPLPDFIPDFQELAFCIRYEVRGGIYWDNNHTLNYTVTITHSNSDIH